MKYYRLEIGKIIHNMVFNLITNQLNIEHPFFSYLVLSESHIYQLMPQDMTVK